MTIQEIIDRYSVVANKFTHQSIDLLTFNVLLYARERLINEAFEKIKFEKHEDAVIRFQAIVKSIFEDGFFTQPSEEIKGTIKWLQQTTGDELVDFIEYDEENNNSLAIFISRVVHIGREIALSELLLYDKDLMKSLKPLIDKKLKKENKEFELFKKKLMAISKKNNLYAK